MKTPIAWKAIGAMLAVTLAGHGAALAQPREAPLAPADSPPRTTDSPPQARDPSERTGDASSQAIDPLRPLDENVAVTEDPDKPWNKGISMADRQAARELFLEGNRLFRIPLFTRAVDMYQAALIRWKNPAFYFNLALAQSNSGQVVEARASLERALEHGDSPLGPDRFQVAQRELAALERKLSRIRLGCRTSGAEVTLDGMPLFIGPGTYEGWITAKPHEILAKKAGYQTEVRRVAAVSGQLQTVDVDLITLTQATDTHRRWPTWGPWAVASAGAAALVTGAAFHALSTEHFNNYNRQFQKQPCAMNSPPRCGEGNIPSYVQDDLTAGSRYRTSAIVAYAIGGGLLMSSAVLLYLNRPRLAETGRERTRAASAQVLSAISPNHLGVMLKFNR